MKRCGATIIVKDECAILPFRCERENGHSRQHLIHYPGQWGEVKIPVEWMGNDRQEVEFYRNSMLDEPVACCESSWQPTAQYQKETYDNRG